MFKIIETTTGRKLFEAETMKEIRQYLRAHYTRFYVICKNRQQYNYFGKAVN